MTTDVSLVESLLPTSTPSLTPNSAVKVSRRRLRVCHECDLLLALPRLKNGENAHCPRCEHQLVKRHTNAAERSLALALSTLIALALSVAFPFLSFNISGIGNRIELTDTAATLVSLHYPLIALSVLLTVIILPALYLCSLVWLSIGMIQQKKLPRSRRIARTLGYMTPWMMADVFVIGTLVSLIKIIGMADIELGLSFWTFCVYALLLLLTIQSVDRDWLWQYLDPHPKAPSQVHLGYSASLQGLAGCNICGLVNRVDNVAPGKKARCLRCDETLHPYQGVNVQATLALLFASLVMYLPANLYPIMITTSLGDTQASTILGGVLLFFQSGDWPIAIIILTASILVPVCKMLILLWLCYVARQPKAALTPLKRTQLYRITEFIGRWSMVDVFVVAILVALIRNGTLMSIEPGAAALSFTVVVVLTMLAAILFDPRSIWLHEAPPSIFYSSHSKEHPHV
ncbi:paraquat-inducible protein A [Oceanisphaera avium]|uniref:Paraquat-inducible membrane protein A n=1 Tax=Oceanisphaera avium TaxID=1903694 RepID=A0A1Y0D0H1_9GAMM|nr:paraquat-inducible protein A [Oceanisphaera avium]ART81082.1 paraquat-inducible membrane protein A [Oceanisphaera avium]